MLMLLHAADHGGGGCTRCEHICINDHYCFPKLEASQWKHHVDDQCPQCFEKRFKLVLAGSNRKARLVPRKKFWYLGLERSIGDFMIGNAAWCHHKGSDSELQQDLHDYKTSPEFARLKEKLKNCIEYGLYEVSSDFGNVFQFCSWSTGIMFIRDTIWCMLLTALYISHCHIKVYYISNACVCLCTCKVAHEQLT